MSLTSLLVGAIVLSILCFGIDDPAGNPFFLLAGLTVVVLALLAGVFGGALFMRNLGRLGQTTLYHSEAFQILAETMREGIVLADIHGRIEYVNPALEKLFGYARGELLGESVERLMPEEYSTQHEEYMQRYLDSGEASIIGAGRQLTALRKNGERFPIYLSIGDINTSLRRLFAAVILDMSEQQRLQREILEIPISEQRRIGQELHDGIGQQLTGLGLLATSLLNKASKPDYELAAQLATGLRDAISQVRALSRGLVPIDVDPGHFVNALENLVDNVRMRTGLDVYLKVREPVRIPDDVNAMHLYRIAQEALNNAIKHADASRIELAIGIEDNRGYLSVHDDGTGFDTLQEDSDGLGLRIMKYRCGLIDAKLIVTSSADEGCEIKCYFAQKAMRDTGPWRES
jgi:two-component system CheB/CheR fusion protein